MGCTGALTFNIHTLLGMQYGWGGGECNTTRVVHKSSGWALAAFGRAVSDVGLSRDCNRTMRVSPVDLQVRFVGKVQTDSGLLQIEYNDPLLGQM